MLTVVARTNVCAAYQSMLLDACSKLPMRVPLCTRWRLRGSGLAPEHIITVRHYLRTFGGMHLTSAVLTCLHFTYPTAVAAMLSLFACTRINSAPGPNTNPLEVRECDE